MRNRGESADGIPTQLPRMSRAEIDALHVGVVQLDDDGVVLLYSRREEQFSGISTESAMGRNFFTEVAPCTNNRLIYQPFRDGVARNHLDLTIEYTFSVQMPPTNVQLHMYRDGATRTNWLIVDPEL